MKTKEEKSEYEFMIQLIQNQTKVMKMNQVRKNIKQLIQLGR